MPITFIYVSPVIIILDSAAGIISGSFILFLLLFLSSMLTGRLFCAWLCPVGGVQECVATAVNKGVRNSKPLHIVRHIIWVVWLGIIFFIVISAGGYRTILPFNHSYMGLSLHTEGGMAYPIYFIVLAIVIVLTLVFGRRSGCHGICHMANFMVFGKKLGQLFRLPRIYMKTDSPECISCKKCSQVCPMSLM
jgi:polyferredoxin